MDLNTANKEVVALQFNGTVRFGLDALRELKVQKNYTKYYTRAVFQLMSALDLGPQWTDRAKMPTLFILDEDGIAIKMGPEFEILEAKQILCDGLELNVGLAVKLIKYLNDFVTGAK